ncbi:MAG: hypothetical protein LZF60_80109 [Nitrospira sp.]|nr:hypothetical protein [Nitrospira sp.]ULA58717.1 MAG: hypothetical protein LZF60_80109 [Nitrospira sp.]
MEQDMKEMEDQAKQAGSSIKDAIHDTASSVEHMAKRAGDAVESAAERVREHLSQDSTAGEAADAVARKVKETSVYLQEQGIGGVVEDLEILIRRYPLQALLLGLGCGYLLSRARTD